MLTLIAPTRLRRRQMLGEKVRLCQSSTMIVETEVGFLKPTLPKAPMLAVRWWTKDRGRFSGLANQRRAWGRRSSRGRRGSKKIFRRSVACNPLKSRDPVSKREAKGRIFRRFMRVSRLAGRVADASWKSRTTPNSRARAPLTRWRRCAWGVRRRDNHKAAKWIEFFRKWPVLEVRHWKTSYSDLDFLPPDLEILPCGRGRREEAAELQKDSFG